MAPSYGHPLQPYYSGAPAPSMPAAYGHHGLPPLGPNPSIPTGSVPQKRTAAQAGHILHDSPPKKMGKWTPEEDALAIELRRGGMKWEDISKRLPGRSAISCRLRYQNYSEKRPDWDEEKKNKLARLYNRFKKDMWDMIAKEMGLPWRAVEAMHWQMGCEDMAQRANVPVFQPHPAPNTKTTTNTPSRFRGSRSPPMLSDSSAGGGPTPPGLRAHLSAPGVQPHQTNRPRRSSSVTSRHQLGQESLAEYAPVRSAAMMPTHDEQAIGPGRDSGEGSLSGRDWGDREGTGTSHHSHGRSGSISSGGSARSGERRTTGPRESAPGREA
ncbi:hypothetical protein BT63DRAFT_189991 [Microthyrium microscopicum]|uniref:Myb-like domain-containing protein n=1 Tax=Microthyrium microscopicum TaxID=703497 RepID=A0A6A6UIX1_9PEZI|nr:hypothetical protein BT63DRAFT_189991 [Microthyrium microscopicum]